MSHGISAEKGLQVSSSLPATPPPSFVPTGRGVPLLVVCRPGPSGSGIKRGEN